MPCHGVDVRCADLGTHQPEVGKPHVIGEDQDDVGAAPHFHGYTLTVSCPSATLVSSTVTSAWRVQPVDEHPRGKQAWPVHRKRPN
jgi:hypothetical protein